VSGATVVADELLELIVLKVSLNSVSGYLLDGFVWGRGEVHTGFW
jgi:hypothetical protein